MPRLRPLHATTVLASAVAFEKWKKTFQEITGWKLNDIFLETTWLTLLEKTHDTHEAVVMTSLRWGFI